VSADASILAGEILVRPDPIAGCEESGAGGAANSIPDPGAAGAAGAGNGAAVTAAFRWTQSGELLPPFEFRSAHRRRFNDWPFFAPIGLTGDGTVVGFITVPGASSAAIVTSTVARVGARTA